MPNTLVINLCSGEERSYSLLPEQAVVAAYEQSRKRWNTWNYPAPEDHPQFRRSQRCVSCGDFTAVVPASTWPKFSVRLRQNQMSPDMVIQSCWVDQRGQVLMNVGVNDGAGIWRYASVTGSVIDDSRYVPEWVKVAVRRRLADLEHFAQYLHVKIPPNS